MLTQLNSAYYEMQLTLHKTLAKLDHKYYALKAHSFSALALFRSHFY